MKRFFRISSWLLLSVIVLGLIGGSTVWYAWSSNLPHISSLEEYRPAVITELFTEDGEVIGRFSEEKRIVVPLTHMPEHLIYAFLAAEDDRFFKHQGVDFIGITRAFFKNLFAGQIEQGGSTITQQVTKSLLLENTERTYRRKAREAILALQIEKEYSKDQILFLYLNQIYLGHGAYGVEAAAKIYFNKSAKELSLSESTLLAGLPQAPSRYSPAIHFDRAKVRQKYVLQRMYEEDYISKKEADLAYLEPINIQVGKKDPFEKAPYFAEYVRQYLLEKYGREVIYREGLKVYTTLNLKMQQAAQRALAKGLSELDKRQGYRGPIRHLTDDEISIYKASSKELCPLPHEIDAIAEGLVEKVDSKRKEVVVRIGMELGRLPFSKMRWARKPNPKVVYYAATVKNPAKILKKGDLISVRIVKEASEPFTWEISLEQTPEVQGALFCMEPESGEVKAMVGGLDFSVSQFNRAVQARRQPGSAFKPIIYAAALDSGMSPADIIIDAPYISNQNSVDDVWKPKNYKEKFFGPTLFRTALVKSRNVVTVKILKEIGVDYAIEYARKLGMESDLDADLSLALGSSGVSLTEITNAYSTFANGGKSVEPIFIERIVDRNGQIIEENYPKPMAILSEETAYVMTDILKAVVSEGTGRRIKALARPAAGKTGTTNEQRDAWYIGYTPGIVTGTWVGYDDRRPMGKGETGSRAASPIWLYFMKEVLAGTPVLDFPVPEGVVFTQIDEKTGLLADNHSKKTVIQAFKQGSEPKEYSPTPTSSKAGMFFQFDLDTSI
jgi:penicillin-binding protein 1A